MITTLAIAHSGLQHQQQRLRASAHHAANLNTTGTASLSVHSSESEDGVRTTTTARLHDRSQPRTITGATPPSLLDEAVAQLTVLPAATAMQRVVHTQDDMIGTLLDISG